MFSEARGLPDFQVFRAGQERECGSCQGAGLGEHRRVLPYEASSIQNKNNSNNNILTLLYVGRALHSDIRALPATGVGTVGDGENRSGHWRILPISCLQPHVLPTPTIRQPQLLLTVCYVLWGRLRLLANL